MSGWMDGWGWIDVWMDGWVDGWMDDVGLGLGRVKKKGEEG